MYTFNRERKIFLKKIKKEKRKILIVQILIIALFLLIWELLVKFNLINSFLFSSPSSILKTIINLFKNSSLIDHIITTSLETFIAFFIAGILGLFIAAILWWNQFLAKVFNPYLTIINSLPKVALGPLIIIWVGASTKSIITMSLTISLIITIINLYNYFQNTDLKYITLFKSFNATKKDIFFQVILPSNKLNIINTMKINMSMNFIGIIMGELLVSKKGIGYLIMYGSQVFNINLIITAILILAILSGLFYYLIIFIEKRIIFNKNIV